MRETKDDVEKRLAMRLAEAGLDRQDKQDKTVETAVSIALEICAEIFRERLQEIDSILEDGSRRGPRVARRRFEPLRGASRSCPRRGAL